MNRGKIIGIRNKRVQGGLLACLLLVSTFLAGTGVAETADPSKLKLIGTIQGGSMPGAVLQDGTGKQVFYSLHDKIPDGSEIISLHEDRISLKGADGTLYDMYISHDTKTAAGSAPGIVSNRPAVAPSSLPSPPPPNPNTPLRRPRIKRSHEEE